MANDGDVRRVSAPSIALFNLEIRFITVLLRKIHFVVCVEVHISPASVGFVYTNLLQYIKQTLLYACTIGLKLL